MTKKNKIMSIAWLIITLVMSITSWCGPLFAQDREPPMTGLVNLSSEPSGADIFAGDSLIGRTPMRVQSAMLDSISVWYPSRTAWNAQVLRPEVEGPDAGVGVRLLRFDARELFVGIPAGSARVQDNGLRIPPADVLLPAGVGLAAGVLAVILKQKGDAIYDDYLRTGDESLLSQTKKYDIYAGVSLALLQFGLGYFIYRLFDE
ncbi:MAG: hypothetical protein IH600_17395 [Bacteroidetes bacterium]|nr:hypothetical protein [Bacteroidota bacterium]